MCTGEELLQTKTTDELIASVKKFHCYADTNGNGIISRLGISHNINVEKTKAPQGAPCYKIIWSDGFHPEKTIYSEDELRTLLIEEISLSVF